MTPKTVEPKNESRQTTNEDLLQAIANPGSMVKILGQQAPTISVLLLAVFVLYQQVQDIATKVELLYDNKSDAWTQKDQHMWEKESLTPLLTEIRAANKEQSDTLKGLEIRLIRIEDRQQRTR